jgi:hypothetical protein
VFGLAFIIISAGALDIRSKGGDLRGFQPNSVSADAGFCVSRCGKLPLRRSEACSGEAAAQGRQWRTAAAITLFSGCR